MGRLIDAEVFKKSFETDCKELHDFLINLIDSQPTAYDVEYELRLLKSYLYHKPKTYRQRNTNWVIVRDLLMANTSHAGMTSCIMKCHELGIDPYGYDLKGGGQGE